MNSEPLVKLPIPLDEPKIANDNELRTQLATINEEFQSLRSQQKQLDEEKGKTSRKIGEAKKANRNEEAEQLKAAVKSISSEIKQIKQAITNLQKAAAEAIAVAANHAGRTKAPPHFRATSSARKQEIQVTNPSIKHATDGDKVNWNRYVEQHPESCLYHRYEFRQVIGKTFGHHCVYLIAEDETGNVVGLLPAVQLKSRLFGNYMVSIPFFNYGGALAESEQIESRLMAELDKIAKSLDCSHVEYRDTFSRANLPGKTEKSSMVLALPEKADTLWDDIGAKVRSQVKKACANNLTIKFGGTELLDDYYKVFAINMRDLGTPVYSSRFFRNLLQEDGLTTHLVVAYHQNQAVSCGFLMAHHDTMEIPWASTLRSANSLNANMFLYWNILKFTIDEGFKFFDFGRSSKDAGTFKFKRQWGAEPQQLYWHYWLDGQGELPELNPNNPKYKFAIAVWQRLPVWLTKIIGPILVKNLP